MDWKSVDCIGMIRLAYQQYSQHLAMYQHGCPTWVGGARQNAIDNGFDILPIDSEAYERLQPGDAIYWYDYEQDKPWYHIGVYVGSYYDQHTQTWYDDAVIEAAKGGEYHTVVARSLSAIQAGLKPTQSLYYGKLVGVDYLN